MGQAIGELCHGAPRAVELGGTTYLVSPPTLADGQTVRDFIKGRLPTPMAATVASLKDIPPQYHDAVLRAAAQVQPGGAELTDEAARKVLLSADGCRFLFWVCARKQHPGLKLEDLKAAIDDSNAAEIFIRLDEATGMARLGKAGGQPG